MFETTAPNTPQVFLRSGQHTFQMECRKRQDYRVRMTSDILSPDYSILPLILEGRRAMVVTTPSVYRLFGERLEALIVHRALDMSIHVLKSGETNKTIAAVEQVCKESLARKMDRTSVLVGLGGGVCTDVVAMAAAAIRRGIDHLRIPTTLIGLVDAGIGLKGGVNLHHKKNYFGCFNPPSYALLDPTFLQTLPTPFLRFGMAEILKMALVADRRLFKLCEAHQHELINSKFRSPLDVGTEIIWIATRAMLHELQKNPYENLTYKRLVDMGHCFSPALEAAAGYQLHHGEAVAIDMALTVTIAEALGYLGSDERNAFIDVLQDAGLPLYHPKLTLELCEGALDEAEAHRGGCIEFPIPVEIGRCIFLEEREMLPGRVIESSLKRLARESVGNT